MMHLVINIPGIPVGKGRPRATRSGHFYTPQRTRDYENLIRLEAARAMDGAAPYEGPLAVHVSAVLPIPASWSRKRQGDALAGAVQPTGRPDIDNYLKAALDGMNQVVFRDDSQVVSMSSCKKYGEVPKLQVHVADDAIHLLRYALAHLVPKAAA